MDGILWCFLLLSGTNERMAIRNDLQALNFKQVVTRYSLLSLQYDIVRYSYVAFKVYAKAIEKQFESPEEQLVRRTMTPRKEASFRGGTGSGSGALTSATPQSLLKRYK